MHTGYGFNIDNKICLAVANTEYAIGKVESLWAEEYVWAVSPEYQLSSQSPLPLVADPLDLPCEVRDEAIRLLNKNAIALWSIPDV